MLATNLETEAPTTAPVEIPAAIGDALADELLLSSAARTKVARVARTHGSGRAIQSHTARAWTTSGDVD